jgi:hypothetical protein
VGVVDCVLLLVLFDGCAEGLMGAALCDDEGSRRCESGGKWCEDGPNSTSAVPL